MEEPIQETFDARISGTPSNVYPARFPARLQHRGNPAVALQFESMKSMGGSGEVVQKGVVTPREARRYFEVARGFQPLSAADMKALRDRRRSYAADGRDELFQISVRYDGKIGREQHGFYSPDAMPL